MDRDPSVTSRIMSAIKNKNTTPELILRKALWHAGFRYRVNYSKLIGRPDIVFTKAKLALFVDGDYWHGHNWALRGYKNLEDELSHYKSFWSEKIIRNVQRDREVNAYLRENGWTVIRIWESEIKHDLVSQVDRIYATYRTLKERVHDEDTTRSD